MSAWNYVVTANKPTNVTHSCVGYFTGPKELNLIIAKCTRIEIYLITSKGLQAKLDVPIYARIAALQLFRPPGETQDVLFIATERYEFCALQWDAKDAEVVTRAMGDVSDQRSLPFYNGQIGMIDPGCRLIGFHIYDGLFQGIPVDDKGQLKELFTISLEVCHVLDIKFLHGCSSPTIVVLYQDYKKYFSDKTRVKSYVVTSSDKHFEGPLPLKCVDNSARLLITVPLPYCGVLVIGEERIAYCSSSAFEEIKITPFITRAYGMVNSNRYLLGDHNGLLHLLVIIHKSNKVTGLELQLLGETSIPSSISYLDNGIVFLGSSYGDSQLIKLNHHPDEGGSYVEVLEKHNNLGPISDFCVVDLKWEGQGEVVTCSGAYKDGSIRIIRNMIEINEQESIQLEGIKGIWSLRSAIDDLYDTFLVLSFIGQTRVFAMNLMDELEENETGGFVSNVHTVFCHAAVYNQLVQVTSNSVRLVSSGVLRHEWFPQAGYSVNVATANATQVLLSSSGRYLVYLEIGDGVLTEKGCTQLEFDVSCLDVNPIGDDPNRSQLAAVGMWTEVSIRIFSLPELNLIKKEHLEGTIIPHSVLLCSFEGISYLFCALRNGKLLNFVLNTSNGELTDKKEVPLGTKPISLRTLSSKNATHVFVASDCPHVINSSNKILHYSTVNLKDVSTMCTFNTAAFPDRLVFANGDELTTGTLDWTQKLHIRSIPLKEQARRTCHQEQTQTFAICSLQYSRSNATDSEMHYIRVLDHQTFECISTYPLNQFECGYSILSCSFSDDSNVYYCVGTAYVKTEEIEPTKGRILVFAVKDRELQLIAEKETKGAVYSLNAFNGKLLAAINQKIQLYKWILGDDDGSHELQFECEHHSPRHTLALHIQTRGDSIVVGDLMRSISLLIYKHEEGAIEERALDYNANWMSALEILENDIYLGAENNFNLFTVRKCSEVATIEERRRLEVVGLYHLGEFVNRFQNGSIVMRLPSDVPTTIFGTTNGAIGVIASLPQEEYSFLERLQKNMRTVIKGVGGLSHEKWRSFDNKKKTVEALNFLDGDLIESFLHLGQQSMNQISMAMDIPVEELVKRVEELTRLH